MAWEDRMRAAWKAARKWAFRVAILLGFLVNSETGHSEDQQPNLRYALGSVKRVKVRATGDLRAHPRGVGHRPALPAYLWAFLLTVKQDTVKSCNRILDTLFQGERTCE